MNLFRRLLWLLLILLTIRSSAQQFGGNPPSLKWKQINTDTARIIFPEGLDLQAQQVAAIVHQLSRTTLPTIGKRQHKIDIVLQNQTVIANGYVGLAPFRSEFQLTPEQNSFDLGSLPWQKLLAIHEYRHVQQYNNFRVGLSGALYYLFGEGGQALANSLALPNWFWEGDAVYQETLVSDQGRGRQPFFFNSYRSLWAGQKNYSWMKLRNGSYRDYVPDWYPLGYMMVSYGREHYGDTFWKKVSLDAAAFRGLFYPLQSAIKRNTGISFAQYHRDALNYFRQPLEKADSVNNPTPIAVDTYARSHHHFVADEEFPQFMGKDSVVYMRSSYKRIPAFVLRNLQDGQETRIGNRSISIDTYFSYRNGKIVYAAYETDPRWGWRDYSVIRILDPQTGEDRKLTSRSKFFSPDISADGAHIITVQEATDGSCQLYLLDSRTGLPESVLPNRDSLFYTYPKFFTDDMIISAVRNTKGQMALASIAIRSGATQYLTSFSYQTLGYPSVHKDTIWFTASRDGQDRIYALAGGRLFQVRLPYGDPMTGQYEFQSGQGKAVWNTFTAVGYKMDAAAERQLQLEPLDERDWVHPLPLQGIDSLNKGAAHLIDYVATGSYPEKKYSSSFHLLHFHSWRPYINDPDYTFSLVSENILNTLQSEIYVDYNRNEQYKQVGVDGTYAAWFPWLDGGWNYTFDRNALYGQKMVFWNEMQANAGFSVPLNFTHHLSYTSFQFGSDVVYNQRYFQGIYKNAFNSDGFAYIDPYITFTNQIQQAQQQIYPRLAQTLSLSYSRAVTTFEANQFLASAYFYLPGLAYTHSLLLGAAFQQRDTLQNARFTNNFPFSRGYTAENFYQMYRLTANYNFPLLYPDWGIGNILYFMRIRANLYYDYTQAMDFYTNGATYNGLYRSYGAEVYFDTKWWNQLPISFGIRYSRLIDPDYEGRGPNQWELILPLNILSEGYSGHGVRPID